MWDATRDAETKPRDFVRLVLGNVATEDESTTLRTVMGLWHASQGSVRLAGQDITAAPTPQIATLGVAYVPESMGIFADLTVAENMLLAARGSKRAAQMDAAWGKPLFKLGLAKLQKADTAGAIELMNKVIAADPNSAEAAQAKALIEQLKKG